MKLIQSGWPLESDDERFNKLAKHFHDLNIEYPQWLREYHHRPGIYWSTCAIEIDGRKIISEKVYSATEYESIPPNALQEITRRIHRKFIADHILEQLGL